MGFDAYLNSPKCNETSTGEVKINVRGMTCNSCVQNIEQVISEKSGVCNIEVSLENEAAFIIYDKKKTTPEAVRDAIEDMGFEASLPGAGSKEKLEAHCSSQLVFQVTGMKCKSCVKKIKDKLSENRGVYEVNVSLEDEKASVNFNPEATTLGEIHNELASLGFKVKQLTSENPPDVVLASTSSGHRSLMKCVIGIKGMTCTSCSTNIQETISGVSGVTDIEVSLNDNKARVHYNSDLISADEIADKIDDMGFDAKVIDRPKMSSFSASKRSNIIPS